MKLLRAGIMAWLLFSLCACGSKRGPTGGEADTEQPTVLSSAPAEMGDISDGIIEIDFSKPLDKASITNSVYIYPPVSERRISLSKATLRIEILDQLQADTNYFVTLSTRIKDLRGNALDKAHSLVFRHGDGALASISGLIEYENPEDIGASVNLSVFSADSLLVLMQELQGQSYEISSLNPATYSLRAYIDKNLNGRYDETAEPIFEESVLASEHTNLDLAMSYVDTTLAQIKRVEQKTAHELEIILSEPLTEYRTLDIFEEGSSERLEILHQYLDRDQLYVLCEKPDSLRYIVRMRNLMDQKGNLSPESSRQFSATLFSDDIPPRLDSSNPRNGATVNDLRPLIELHFSEIMTESNLQVKLLASDSQKEAKLDILSIKGRKVTLQPSEELTNYRSYRLIILKESTDYSGNSMAEDSEVLFLPIKR
jgi:hypothetical protein